MTGKPDPEHESEKARQENVHDAEPRCELAS
jgi:hypothetical protein